MKAIIDKIKKLFLKHTDSSPSMANDDDLFSVSQSSRDRRRLSRIIINPIHSSICFSFEHSEERHKIFNLSYDGLGLETAIPPITNFSPDAINSGTLHILGRAQHCRYYVVRTTERNQATYLGLRFVHEDNDLLLFLRDYLEPMYWGQSLRTLKEHMGDNTNNSQYVLRGDGPTTLKIMLNSSGNQLASFHLTFKAADQYREVVFNNNTLTVRQANTQAVNAGNNALSPATTTTEQQAIQTAAAILIAANLEPALKNRLLASLI